jgi:hypothetical protein
MKFNLIVLIVLSLYLLSFVLSSPIIEKTNEIAVTNRLFELSNKIQNKEKRKLKIGKVSRSIIDSNNGLSSTLIDKEKEEGEKEELEEEEQDDLTQPIDNYDLGDKFYSVLLTLIGMA